MSDVEARVYIRISRPSEKDILNNQRKAALGYVEKQGFLLVADPYEDIRSGGTTDRPGLNSLLKDLRRGDVVVFTSLSRMTRGGIGSALDILRMLQARGVGWHFVEQPILNFDSNTHPLARDIILAVLAAVDEDYRRTISQKTRKAYEERKRLAEQTGTKVVWGRPKKSLPSHEAGEKA